MTWIFLSVVGDQIDQTLQQSQNIFRKLLDTVLNVHSLLVLLLSVVIAILLGRLIGMLLRRVTVSVAKRADKIEDLGQVNRLRRIETLIVLSIAVIRALLLALALFFWWNFSYPYHNLSSTIGASVIFIVIVGGALGPALQDIAAGSLMMAEQWFGVGDHIKVEPFVDLQGVVERITLRSTRIRGLNGEIIWLNNKTMQAVRVTPRGIRTIALELFVSDIDQGIKLIERASLQLPNSPLMLVNPLAIMTTHELGSRTWQITAIGETAPGREWLLEKRALDLIIEIDKEESETPVLLSDPLARYADSEAERKFARTIHNARKQRVKRHRVRRPKNGPKNSD